MVDAYGNLVPTATTPVTLALAGGPGGAILACTGGLTRAAVAGVAAFAGCKVDQAGTGYTLVASAAGMAASRPRRSR